MGQALDIVNTFMQSQDASLLADDFRFSGPVDQTTGIDAFIKLNFHKQLEDTGPGCFLVGKSPGRDVENRAIAPTRR